MWHFNIIYKTALIIDLSNKIETRKNIFKNRFAQKRSWNYLVK